VIAIFFTENPKLTISCMKNKVFLCSLSLLIVLVLTLNVCLGCTWNTHDILGAALSAGCALFFYGTETQPAFTIVVGYANHWTAD
jgi:hypothetical protein